VPLGAVGYVWFRARNAESVACDLGGSDPGTEQSAIESVGRIGERLSLQPLQPEGHGMRRFGSVKTGLDNKSRAARESKFSPTTIRHPIQLASEDFQQRKPVMSVRTPSAVIAAGLVTMLSQSAVGQVITSWGAPSVDDGNPIPNFVATWNSDPATGQITNLPEVYASISLAADNENARLFASRGTSLNVFELDDSGNFVPMAPSTLIRDESGEAARLNQITSMGFGHGVLYAGVFRSALDEGTGRGIPRGLYTINVSNAVATPVAAASNFPLILGMDFNSDDGFMYAVVGENNAQSIVRFDLVTFTIIEVAALPASVYAGQVGLKFDGVAVGEGKVFLTTGLNSGYGNVPIAVYDIAAGTFVQSLPNPTRSAENRYYSAGATYFNPTQPPSPCSGDVNLDGTVDGSDLAAVVSNWGGAGTGDIDANGLVDGADLGVVLNAWGPCR
jgi:hypothetical protein